MGKAHKYLFSSYYLPLLLLQLLLLLYQASTIILKGSESHLQAQNVRLYEIIMVYTRKYHVITCNTPSPTPPPKHTPPVSGFLDLLAEFIIPLEAGDVH